jgi:hypothetical protein
MFDYAHQVDQHQVDQSSDEDLVARAVEIERLRARFDAEQAMVLGELEVRGVCDRDHGLPTSRWLAREADLPSKVANARVSVGVKLSRSFPLVAKALADGEIGWDHAKVIVEVANPRILDVVVDNQVLLLTLAQRCRFEPWRAEVQALARLWDQDGGFDPNHDPASNRLSHGTTLDGLTSMAATFTADNGALVTQAIEARADELYRQAVRDHETCPELRVPSRATLRALALVELIREGLGVDVDTSKQPRVEITLVVPADDLTSATDPDGTPLSDGTTRVLACDAVYLPLVVDRLGVPLAHGRGTRFATPAQRRAVRTRDGGCVFPGCDARVTWCDVHHCIHFDDGGVTDVCNLVCLCRHHHTVVHRPGWSVHLQPDGWTVFTPPSGRAFWGQRHGRRRDGPPPEGAARPARRSSRPRRERHDDPYERAHVRQLVLRRLVSS